MKAASKAPGDTVWFRGGAYTDSASSNVISPDQSGTSGARVTFAAYPGETPIITNTYVAGTLKYPIVLLGDDYIVVRGLQFVNFPRPITIYGGADYNEIDLLRCLTDRGDDGTVVAMGIIVTSGGTASTHNWIHHNTVSTIYRVPCGESGDGIMIGDTGANYDSNYNTVEDNTIYHLGHSGTENFTQYNVWRGNWSYNDGFKTFTANLTGTATGGSSTTMIDTPANFTDLGVMAGSFLYLHDFDDVGVYGGPKEAAIAEIATTTNPNDTLTYSIIAGRHADLCGRA